MAENGNGRNGVLYEKVRVQLKGVREKSSATIDHAQQAEILAKSLVDQCREWRTGQEELERLINQILAESGDAAEEEKRRKSHRHRSSRRKRRHDDEKKSSRRKSSKKSKSGRAAVPAEQQSGMAVAAASGETAEHALTVEHIFSSAEKDLCRRCSGDVEQKAGAMSNKQLTKLICELLLKDEDQYKCKHCFCEKCTGIKSRKRTRCRKYKRKDGDAAPESTCGKTSGVCENTQCDKNTQIIVKHLAKGMHSRPQSTKSRHSRRSGKSSKKSRKDRKERKSQKI